MATLTVTISSAQGTSNKVLTFTAADASRIMAAYQDKKPGGTQDQLAIDLALILKEYLQAIVFRKEQIAPIPVALD